MQIASSRGSISAINVTPMIDVILVLLIIFMLISPVIQHGYAASIPEAADSPAPAADQIVLSYGSDGVIRLNRDVVTAEELQTRLRAILSGSSERMIFFVADPDADYQETMTVLDLAHEAGAKNIGLLPEHID